MMKGLTGVLGASVLLACSPASAQELSRPELGIGILQHGANFHPLGDKLFFDKQQPDIIYLDTGEDRTVDVQLVYRTAPLRFALKPRLTGKVQINTAGRTSFASVGAEWRQHAFRNRVYGQIGIGVTIHDGYRFIGDPFEPGISNSEAWRRYDLVTTRVAFGSRVLFNPNASIGVRLNPRWAIEATWEHFSHRQIFNEVNPGIDNVGVRLTRTLGRTAR